MSGGNPRDHNITPDMAVKADIVAWVGKLDDAVDQLYREIDRLPGLIRKEARGEDPELGGSRQGPTQ